MSSVNIAQFQVLREKPVRRFSDDNTSVKTLPHALKIHKFDSRLPSLPPIKTEAGSKGKPASLFASLFERRELPSRRHSLPHVPEFRTEPEKLLSDKQKLTDARLVNFCNKLPEGVRITLSALEKDFPSLKLRAQRLREELSRSKEVRKLESLDLSRQNLLIVPDEIEYFTRLRTLNLSENRISSLPSSIRNLKSIESLRMDNCALKEIPPVVYELKSLKILSLSKNSIACVAPQIGELSKLRYLLLSSNLVVSLPKELCNLWKLKVLDLGNNRLTGLPSRLPELDVLELLFINNNPFPNHILPETIGDVPKLIALYVDVMQNFSLYNFLLLEKVSRRGCVLSVT